MNKKDVSERDICSKFIGPAVKRAGWDGMMQIREEVAFTKGRIVEAEVKAVVEKTHGVRLQVSFGNETALIYLWQVVEKLRS